VNSKINLKMVLQMCLTVFLFLGALDIVLNKDNIYDHYIYASIIVFMVYCALFFLYTLFDFVHFNLNKDKLHKEIQNDVIEPK
jgi:phosphotransferase system  glucose/maltose/N-acetylglucosamine-specific IIC component